MTQAIKKIDQERIYLINNLYLQKNDGISGFLYIRKRDYFFAQIKRSLISVRNSLYNGIEDLLINRKTVRWALMFMLFGYHLLLLIGVFVAQWTPDWLAIDGYSIWSNWISDLGGNSYTPMQILFNFACILAGIFCILLNLTLGFIFRKKYLQSSVF